MNLRKFEEFLATGVVRKQTPNRERALSLIKEAEEKKQFLDVCMKKIPSELMNPNFIIDCCYDILMEFVRAKMFVDGYNAGNSHEAEVSYMRNIDFSEADVMLMNEMRYYRNGTKYYGSILSKEYAEKVLQFMNRTYPKLKRLVL